MITDNERFSALAKTAIVNFQKHHKSAQASLQVIADKTGTSYSTIRNILYKETPISFKMAKNILIKLSPEMTTQELIQLLGDSDAEKLRNFYSHNLDTQLIDDKYEIYFKQESYFEILIRAFSDRGISESDVKETFGQNGLSKLSELLQVGLLIKKDERIFGNAQKDINLSLETTKVMAELALKRHRSHNPHDSWLTFHSQSYNQETYNQIKEILRESFKKISALPVDPSGQYQAVAVQLLIDLDKDFKTVPNERNLQ